LKLNKLNKDTIQTHLSHYFQRTDATVSNTCEHQIIIFIYPNIVILLMLTLHLIPDGSFSVPWSLFV